MIETRGAKPLIHALGSFPLPLARHLMRVERLLAMANATHHETSRAVNGAHTLESTLVTLPVVPQRSGRRAAARQRKGDDVERRIIEYLKGRPHSTTGDKAKGLNANRNTIAAGVSHMARAGEITKDYAAI